MRSSSFAPLVVVIAVVAWLFFCDEAGCETAWHDMLAFAHDFFQGKRDPVEARRVLGEIGTVLQISFNRGAKDVHLPLKPLGNPGDIDSSLVLIKGDAGQGTGVLVQLPDGPVIVTSFHVIAGNPNFHFTTHAGVEVPVLSLGGAGDRDVALLGIEDNNYHYLKLAQKVDDTVQTGDEVVTPGDGDGGVLKFDTTGKVAAIDPDRIEIDLPAYQGKGGGPVVDQESGFVVGVMAFAVKTSPADFVNKAASFGKAGPPDTSDQRHSALRIDTVTQWEEYDMSTVGTQSTFLRNFHENSRCLDSYLNGPVNETQGFVAAGQPDSNYYQRSPQLRSFTDPSALRKSDHGGLGMNAVHYALLDCMNFAQQDFVAIQNSSNFYPFEWTLAQEELAYRQALISELQRMGG